MEDFRLEELISAAEDGNEEYFVDHFDIKVFLDKLKTHDFYHYEGSLTTPKCAEIVEWIVFKEPVFISPTNLEIIQSHMGISN